MEENLTQRIAELEAENKRLSQEIEDLKVHNNRISNSYFDEINRYKAALEIIKRAAGLVE